MKAECPELKSPVRNIGNFQQNRGANDVKKFEAPKPRGRAFQITTEEAKVTPDVVTCNFLVNSVPAHILFDSGASRSFVSTKFVHHPLFVIEKLPTPLEVEIADNKNFLVFDVYRSCILTIEDENYQVISYPYPWENSMWLSVWIGYPVIMPISYVLAKQSNSLRLVEGKYIFTERQNATFHYVQ